MKNTAKKHEVTLDFKHSQYDTIMASIKAGLNTMLVGPAGSGKTFLCQQIAKELGLDFYFTGAVNQPHRITGFVLPSGKEVMTQFRVAFERGGLFLFDEIDGSSANVLLAVNAALSSGILDIDGVDEPIKQHPNFVCVAAANTYGRGRDMQYVGRNQMDGSSLDRYVVVPFDYDYDLERAIAIKAAGDIPKGKYANGEEYDYINDWVDHIQMLREVAYDKKIKHIISPRATLAGIALLKAGITDPNIVREMTVWKGLDEDQIKIIADETTRRKKKEGNMKIVDADGWSVDDAKEAKAKATG